MHTRPPPSAGPIHTQRYNGGSLDLFPAADKKIPKGYRKHG